MAASAPLRLLIVEDQATDAELIVDQLRQDGFEPDWHRVETEAEYLAHLNPMLDLILSDNHMPQFNALSALNLLQERGFDIPFIIVSGTIGEERAVSAMKQGVTDYLLKDRLTRLGQAVKHALREKALRAEKQQAEVALRENEARLRRLTENAPDIIYRYRLVPTAGLEYINPAVTAMTGYSMEECYTNPSFLFNLAYEEDSWLLQRLIGSGQDLTQVEAVMMRWVHKTGAILWVEQRHVLLYDEKGQLVAIEGIVRDITERKRAEVQLLHAELLRTELAKEKEVIELKERFIAMVSHDFRTPLTVIQMGCDLLTHYFDRLSSEKRNKFLNDIRVQVKYMLDLLNAVLVVNKAQSGKLRAEPVPLDLIPFCRDIVEHLRLTAAVEHRFIFTAETGLDTIFMDENLLQRILINLLSNAVKYSPNGGEIRFEVGVEGQEIIFRISDQGIGIPAEDQKKLFEAFSRGSNTGKISGTGLGLAIVKSTVDVLGGTLTCVSVEGKGTTFTVRLPLVFPSPQ